MIALLAFWAAMLVLAFAMMLWGGGADIRGPAGGALLPDRSLFQRHHILHAWDGGRHAGRRRSARILAVGEAGTGFGFLAIMIAYLPTLYGALSQREVNISLLDARAGSPPTAGELLAASRAATRAERPSRISCANGRSGPHS